MAKEILTGSKASTTVKTLNGRAILDANSIHGLSVSGNTITYTKGDDSTGTIAVTPSSHNQASNTINAMTGYSKPSSTSAIAATDTLNSAVGKLEKALDGKAASSHTHKTTDLSEPAYIAGSQSLTMQAKVDYLRTNKFIFLPADQIIIEKTTDGGTTWVDAQVSDAQKENLFNETRTGSVSIPLKNGVKSLDCGIRITITGMKYNVPAGTAETQKYSYWNSTYVKSNERYCSLNDLYMWVSTQSDSMSVKVERATGANSTNWIVDFNNSDFFATGWSGSDYVKLSGSNFGGGTTQTSNYWNWRMTFMTKGTASSKGATLATNATTNSIQIIQLAAYGLNCWTPANSMMKYDHLYSWDASKNATFPADVKATSFTENGTALSSKYLGISAKASSATISDTFAASAGTDNSNRYVYFAYNDSNYTGASATKGKAAYDADFKYNPSTNTLTVGSITGKAATAGVADSANAVAWANVSDKPSFFDGNYNSLINKPTIPTVNNATLTIQKNGTQVATFTANASSNVTANITVPTVTDTYSSTSSNAMSGKAVASALSTTKVGSATTADSATTATTANALASTATIEASQVNGLSTLLDEAGKVKTVNSIQPDTNGDVALTNVSMGQGYGTCTTAAATAAKVGTLANYSLITGGVVSIKFTYAVPASATLNINSKGAKSIYNRGSAIAANVIAAGDTATFMYDGTRYNLLSIDKAYLTSHQSLTGYVPTTRTVNSKALSSNITLTASDVGALPVNDPTATSGLKVKNTSLTKGTNPSSIAYNGIWITDSSATQTQATRLGGFETQINTNGESITRLQGYGYGSGSADATTIQLGVRADGSKWTSVTPPPDDSWDDSIATTGWVRSNVGGALDIDYLADEQLLVFERQTQTESVHSESVGFITISLSNTVPAGYLPLIGYTYSRSAYADLYNYAVTNGLVISDSEWLALENNQNGNVPFYSSGNGSTTFRVPKLNGWVKAGESAGNYIEAGLPNIEGEWIPGIRNPRAQRINGAFSEISGSNVSSWSSSGNNTPYGFKFDASNSNSIYGNSNTVQPESVSVIYVVKAFGEITNIGSTDLSTLSDQITYITNNYVPKNGGTANNLRVDGLTLEGRKVMRNPEKVKIYEGTTTTDTMNFSQSWRNFDALCFVVKCEGTGAATMCTTVIKQAYEIQLLIDIGATNIGIDFQPRGDSDRSWLSYYLPNKNGSTDTSWVRAYRRLTYVAEVWGLTY